MAQYLPKLTPEQTKLSARVRKATFLIDQTMQLVGLVQDNRIEALLVHLEACADAVGRILNSEPEPLTQAAPAKRRQADAAQDGGGAAAKVVKVEPETPLTFPGAKEYGLRRTAQGIEGNGPSMLAIINYPIRVTLTPEGANALAAQGRRGIKPSIHVFAQFQRGKRVWLCTLGMPFFYALQGPLREKEMYRQSVLDVPFMEVEKKEGGKGYSFCQDEGGLRSSCMAAETTPWPQEGIVVGFGAVLYTGQFWQDHEHTFQNDGAVSDIERLDLKIDAPADAKTDTNGDIPWILTCNQGPNSHKGTIEPPDK